MKTIQARLQSRISKRGAEISNYENLYTTFKSQGTSFLGVKEIREYISMLSDDQKLDKDIISAVYWNTGYWNPVSNGL